VNTSDILTILVFISLNNGIGSGLIIISINWIVNCHHYMELISNYTVGNYIVNLLLRNIIA